MTPTRTATRSPVSAEYAALYPTRDAELDDLPRHCLAGRLADSDIQYAPDAAPTRYATATLAWRHHPQHTVWIRTGTHLAALWIPEPLASQAVRSYLRDQKHGAAPPPVLCTPGFV